MITGLIATPITVVLIKTPLSSEGQSPTAAEANPGETPGRGRLNRTRAECPGIELGAMQEREGVISGVSGRFGMVFIRLLFIYYGLKLRRSKNRSVCHGSCKNANEALRVSRSTRSPGRECGPAKIPKCGGGRAAGLPLSL